MGGRERRKYLLWPSATGCTNMGSTCILTLYAFVLSLAPLCRMTTVPIVRLERKEEEEEENSVRDQGCQS